MSVSANLEKLVVAIISDGMTTPEAAFNRAMGLVNAELDAMMREPEFRGNPLAIADAAAERALARLQPANPASLN